MITLTKNKILYNSESFKNNENSKEVHSIIPHLSEMVKIEDNFTLYDFFMMLEKDKNLISVLFSSYMSGVVLDPFIEEVKKDCLEEGKEEIHYLECSWSIDQFDYKEFYKKHKKEKPIFPDENLREPSEEDENEISIGVNFCGIGEFNGVNDGYGIEFTPLYRLKHLPLKLNTKFEMFKPNQFDGKPVAKGYMDFTLFEVISEILSEITFRGSPENRDEEWEIISEDYQEMKDRLEQENKEKEK